MRTIPVLILLAIFLVASCVTPPLETGLSNDDFGDDSSARPHSDSFECQSDTDCVTGGCSSTICQSKQGEQLMSICEWREEYACYNSISCGCNEGICEWEKTPEFQSCIAEKSKLNEGME